MQLLYVWLLRPWRRLVARRGQLPPDPKVSFSLSPEQPLTEANKKADLSGRDKPVAAYTHLEEVTVYVRR